ncbi:MAG: hypothetical protein KGZ53_07215 [Peptococcaceae bacterium]|nr:hypothetical protein [Peptococcaceae bacterium]
MNVVHASSIGYAAQSILHANEDLLGEVHSSFRRAFNIHTYSGQIVSFSTAGTPNFPTNVVTNLTDQPGFVS